MFDDRGWWLVMNPESAAAAYYDLSASDVSASRRPYSKTSAAIAKEMFPDRRWFVPFRRDSETFTVFDLKAPAENGPAIEEALALGEKLHFNPATDRKQRWIVRVAETGMSKSSTFVWDLNALEPRRTKKALPGYDPEFAGPADRFFIASTIDELLIWESDSLLDSNPKYRLKDQFPVKTCTLMSPSGRYLFHAPGARANGVSRSFFQASQLNENVKASPPKLWDLSASPPSPIAFPAEPGEYYSYLAFSRDERWVIGATSKVVKIWPTHPDDVVRIAKAYITKID